MVNFWKPKTGKQLKPSRLNPWSISLDKPAKAFYGDSDGDRVMNMFDCQPKNRKKQGPEHEELNLSDSQIRGQVKEATRDIRERAERSFRNTDRLLRKAEKIEKRYHQDVAKEAAREYRERNPIRR